MALGRLTSFTFGNSFLTLVYANSQTYYVSYAHIIAGESDSRSGDLTIWIYTAGEVGETLSVKNSDLVAIGSSATAFLALFNQNIQPYSYWQDFLDSTTASGALPSEPSALRGQCLYARFRPIYNFGSASLINVPARFKAGTLYSQVPDTGAGDFTVTRATTPTAGRSTRINKDGLIELVADNVPRLDYPLGGAVNGCPALLVEPSAINSLFHSEAFDDVYWTKNGTTAQGNVAISPSNTLTADNIYPTVSGGDQRLQRSISIVNGTTYTSSIFAKANGINWIRFFAAQFNAAAWFNVQSGTIGTVQAGVTARIENYGNGWYRCSVTQTVTTTGTGQVYINITDSNGSGTVTASGTNGILFWGAQLETGTVATSYIPTTTAAITRGADLVSKTGVSSLIGQTEGTIYAEVTFAGGLTSRPSRQIMNISDGTDNNRASIYIDTNTTNIYGFISANASNLFNNGASFAGVTSAKIALAYKSGDYAIYVNGSLVASGTTAFSFATTLNQVTLGSRHNFIGQLNDRIRAAALYPNRLTNAQLATLTTP